ncbi:MAG TPA: extracellular solute-binding protein, partial [Anaerolineae bacterium]
LLWSNGGDIFDKNWKPIFNSPEGIQATQRYVDWVNKLKIAAQNSKTFGEADGSNEFVQGRAAMWLGWSWYYANFTNPKLATPDVAKNVAFTVAPSWEGKGKTQTYGYIWETGIFKGSKNKDAAWEYLKWMTSPVTEKWVVMDKSDPKRDNVVAVHYSVLKDPAVNKLHNGLQANIAAALDTARALPMMPDWLQVQGIIEVAINDCANGKPIQATMDKAAADVTALLKNLGYY